MNGTPVYFLYKLQTKLSIMKISKRLLVCFFIAPLTTASGQQLSLDEVLAEERALVAGQGVRAQLIAVQNSVISSGLAAKIKNVAFSVGDYIKENEILIEFDCDSLLAQQKIVDAQSRAAKINLEVKQRLFELNNVGAQELALSEVEADAATAQLEVMQLQIEQCVIRAPYNGRVVARNADPFETVNAGAELIEILAQDDLEVLLVAPSQWLEWLEIGEGFVFEVEEISAQFQGEVLRLGGEVDPVSQTVLVWGVLSNPSSKLLPGMSGNIAFDELR